MRKFFRLSPAERRLLLKTFLLVALVRSGLTLLPLRLLRKGASRLMVPGRVAPEEGISPERIARMVAAAAGLVPRATCLTQALAAQILLVRRGHDAMLRIGVARDRSGAFTAHAWIEQEGRVIVGERGYREFTPLPQAGERGL